jgi:hypothetical protein
MEEAVICVKCGCSVENFVPAVQMQKQKDTLSTVIKVFLILACVVQGFLLIPLAWCLPITINIFNRLNNQQPISTGLKVCTLLFVSLIAGICLLCIDD